MYEECLNCECCCDGKDLKFYSYCKKKEDKKMDSDELRKIVLNLFKNTPSIKEVVITVVLRNGVSLHYRRQELGVFK